MSSIKASARQIFSPILSPLEDSPRPYVYTRQSRLILWVMSVLFIGLAIALGVWLPNKTDGSVWIPVGVFGLLGTFGVLVAWLGTDKAVAKVWGSR
jgi:lipopolysaccharide export LptBFGC system permease protein LptF